MHPEEGLPSLSWEEFGHGDVVEDEEVALLDLVGVPLGGEVGVVGGDAAGPLGLAKVGGGDDDEASGVLDDGVGGDVRGVVQHGLRHVGEVGGGAGGCPLAGFYGEEVSLTCGDVDGGLDEVLGDAGVEDGCEGVSIGGVECHAEALFALGDGDVVLVF